MLSRECLYILPLSAFFVKHFSCFFLAFSSFWRFEQFVYDILYDIVCKKHTIYTKIVFFQTNPRFFWQRMIKAGRFYPRPVSRCQSQHAPSSREIIAQPKIVRPNRPVSQRPQTQALRSLPQHTCKRSKIPKRLPPFPPRTAKWSSSNTPKPSLVGCRGISQSTSCAKPGTPPRELPRDQIKVDRFSRFIVIIFTRTEEPVMRYQVIFAAKCHVQYNY